MILLLYSKKENLGFRKFMFKNKNEPNDFWAQWAQWFWPQGTTLPLRKSAMIQTTHSLEWSENPVSRVDTQGARLSESHNTDDCAHVLKPFTRAFCSAPISQQKRSMRQSHWDTNVRPSVTQSCNTLSIIICLTVGKAQQEAEEK